LPKENISSRHNKYNNSNSTSEIIEKYLKDFFKLRVLYNFNGFEVRDINQQDVNVPYIDGFIFNFSDEIFMWMQSVEDNVELKNNKKGDNISSPLDKYEIMQELTNVAKIDDFDIKNENEIFLRFPGETRKIIEASKSIIDQYYNHWKSIVPKYFINKSFFISWYFKEMGSSEWKDWKEIEEIIKNK